MKLKTSANQHQHNDIFFAVMLDILTPQKYRKNYTKG